MDDQTLEVLEYTALLRHLASFASTEVGRERCLDLKPSSDAEKIRLLLREVTEAGDLMDRGSSSPLSSFEEVRPLLEYAAVQGTILEGTELTDLLSFLRVSESARAFFSDQDIRYPLLCSHAYRLTPQDELLNRIVKAVAPDGTLRDDASPELLRIRRRLQQEKRTVLQRMEGLLGRNDLKEVWQDKVITFRNDRFVVAVKSGARHALPGIIHDISQSKATCFVEPAEVVDLNNELSLLGRMEKDEVRRILAELTSVVREELPLLHENLEVVADIDLIWSKARMSRFLDAVEPELGEEGPTFHDAVHPLLYFRWKKGKGPTPKPIYLSFPDDTRVLVISGANMGGKTAALKTLGLLSLMAQSGMHVPCREPARAVVFDRIFAVIGDEQDLVHDLSTFSSQMKRIMTIFSRVNERSLVLLDEVCTNTDPVEGGALALAFLDRLGRMKCRTVVTTHYGSLKAYAVTNDQAMNVSVETDAETHHPAYTLKYGVPGVSNALAVASLLGMDRELIRKAEGFLSPADREALNLIQDLDRTHSRLKEEERRAARTAEELERAKAAYEGMNRELQAERQRILDEERRSAQEVVRRAEQNFRRILREARKLRQTPKPQEEHRLHAEIKEIRREVIGKLTPPAPRSYTPPPATAKPGDLVRLRGSNQVGVLMSLGGNGEDAQVMVKGIKVKTRSDKLEFVQAVVAPASAEHRVDLRPFPHPSREVKVVGMRVEDALDVVDKSIDEAVLSGVGEIELVHGIGTGRLKAAISGFLKDHSAVRGFHHKDPHKGGQGVTVVELSA